MLTLLEKSLVLPDFTPLEVKLLDNFKIETFISSITALTQLKPGGEVGLALTLERHIGANSTYIHKKDLETGLNLVTVKLKSDMELSAKKALIVEVLSDVSACTPGFHSRVLKAITQPPQENSIDYLLYQQRLDIVTRCAHNASPDIHVHNDFFKQASINFGVKPIHENDPYAFTRGYSAEAINKRLESVFAREYLPFQILANLKDQIKTSLIDIGYKGRLSIENAYIVADQEAFLKFALAITKANLTIQDIILIFETSEGEFIDINLPFIFEKTVQALIQQEFLDADDFDKLFLNKLFANEKRQFLLDSLDSPVIEESLKLNMLDMTVSADQKFTNNLLEFNALLSCFSGLNNEHKKSLVFAHARQNMFKFVYDLYVMRVNHPWSLDKSLELLSYLELLDITYQKMLFQSKVACELRQSVVKEVNPLVFSAIKAPLIFKPLLLHIYKICKAENDFSFLCELLKSEEDFNAIGRMHFEDFSTTGIHRFIGLFGAHDHVAQPQILFHILSMTKTFWLAEHCAQEVGSPLQDDILMLPASYRRRLLLDTWVDSSDKNFNLLGLAIHSGVERLESLLDIIKKTQQPEDSPSLLFEMLTQHDCFLRLIKMLPNNEASDRDSCLILLTEIQNLKEAEQTELFAGFTPDDIQNLNHFIAQNSHYATTPIQALLSHSFFARSDDAPADEGHLSKKYKPSPKDT